MDAQEVQLERLIRRLENERGMGRKVRLLLGSWPLLSELSSQERERVALAVGSRWALRNFESMFGNPEKLSANQRQVKAMFEKMRDADPEQLRKLGHEMSEMKRGGVAGAQNRLLGALEEVLEERIVPEDVRIESGVGGEASAIPPPPWLPPTLLEQAGQPAQPAQPHQPKEPRESREPGEDEGPAPAARVERPVERGPEPGRAGPAALPEEPEEVTAVGAPSTEAEVLEPQLQEAERAEPAGPESISGEPTGSEPIGTAAEPEPATPAVTAAPAATAATAVTAARAANAARAARHPGLELKSLQSPVGTLSAIEALRALRRLSSAESAVSGAGGPGETGDAGQPGSAGRADLVGSLGSTWAARRAVSSMIRSHLAADLDEALSLIRRLPTAAQRTWCLGDLVEHWRLDAAGLERVLGAAPTPTSRRRLARRAARAS